MPRTQKKKTLILTLDNYLDFFDKENIIPKFTPIFVDLNGHGIRSMEYDNVLDGIIIIAGPVPSAFDFELFLYDGKETKSIIIEGFHETVLKKQLRLNQKAKGFPETRSVHQNLDLLGNSLHP